MPYLRFEGMLMYVPMTNLLILQMQEARRRGLTVVWVDTEMSFDKDFIKKIKGKNNENKTRICK